jgi:hypothetical protein
VLSWYDNEWGFSNRMADTAVAMAKLIWCRCAARHEQLAPSWKLASGVRFRCECLLCAGIAGNSNAVLSGSGVQFAFFCLRVFLTGTSSPIGANAAFSATTSIPVPGWKFITKFVSSSV